MARYTVSEVAERTGFASSALRYYDKLGLVRPVGRSDAGYRLSPLVVDDPGEVGVLEPGAVQVGCQQVRIAQSGPSKVRPDERRAGEVRGPVAGAVREAER
jgi:hypothetical protein